MSSPGLQECFMFFKLKSYLNFLLKSTNQHGVHSPFVFSFITKCIYTKKRLHPQKTINILLKSIDYFDFMHIQIYDNPKLKSTILNSYPKLKFNEQTTDLLFINDLDQNAVRHVLSNKTLHNHSMLLVDGIHSNLEKENLWKRLIRIPNITVSLDMYHCGVLFLRKEQEKEHFTIRI